MTPRPVSISQSTRPVAPPSSWEGRILILKPSSLGDVVHAIPVLRLLRLQFPHAQIDWWLEQQFFGLLEGDRDLTRLIPFQRQGLQSLRGAADFTATLQTMRSTRYDWVIDLQGLARSALVGWFANGGLMVGVQDEREGAPAFQDHTVPRPGDRAHAVDWYLEVIKRLGVPVERPFEWFPVRESVREKVMARWSPRNHRWVCLQPGARWLNKRWPIEHFERLILQLIRSTPEAGVRFAVMGGASDASLGQRLRAIAPEHVLDLTGQVSLAEMIEWIRLCQVMVTNDTGPMHVAAALNKPVVSMFGPTDPSRTGPYGQIEAALRVPLACAPCFKDSCANPKTLECLRSITPERVADDVVRRLRLRL